VSLAGTVIAGGTVVDPVAGRATLGDVVIKDGRLVGVMRSGEWSAEGTTVIDARGLLVLPGLVDMHVHLREPGFEYKETIATAASRRSPAWATRSRRTTAPP